MAAARSPNWWRARTAISLTAAMVAGHLATGGARQQQPPAPFRSGTNIIRVDATVIDRSGRPATGLTADDFEVKEDGAVQPVTSFTFLSNKGIPSDDRSLVIRSPQHAAAEAARDDVRVFLLFWDEYHIGRFESTLRAKAALSRMMLTAFGPTDLVAIMDPLTPSSAIEFTRDRRALADRVHALEGRLRVYLPPRSAAEEEQLKVVNWRPEAVEGFRGQVTVSAIKAAAMHLGTLREGRKTMIVVSEGISVLRPAGFGGAQSSMDQVLDESSTAVDILRAANDANTAVHIVDPRGLQIERNLSTLFETLASGTGGELHRTNDLGNAVERIVDQASATYLLGYTREVPLDGRFHEIKVRVKRGGYDVRARSGYWAPRVGDVQRAKAAAEAAVLRPPVAAAFGSLPAPNSSKVVDISTSRWPLPDGRTLLSIAWSALPNQPPGSAATAVSAQVTTPGAPAIEKTVAAGGTTFDIPDAEATVALRVSNAAGEIIDREVRTIAPLDAAQAVLAVAAIVRVARSPAEQRAVTAADAPIHAGREFVRTDRLWIRVLAFGSGSAGAEMAARLIDRRGNTLTPLAVKRSPDGWHELDLPLASIAPGDFAVVFEAHSGAGQAETLVPFRVRR
jgi:VWFA-related protein